jgi:hypothetical protein
MNLTSNQSLALNIQLISSPNWRVEMRPPGTAKSQSKMSGRDSLWQDLKK